MSIGHRLLFRARSYWSESLCILRQLVLRIGGMRIGHGTRLSRVHVNWLHQVAIGRECTLEPDVVFKFDGPWKLGPRIRLGDRCFLGRACEFNISFGIEIGSDTLIASGCRFIDHNHGFSNRGLTIGQQMPVIGMITIGPDVWLGVNVVVLCGVRIGRGAVVAAGSVVRCNIPEYEVWGGVPARRLKARGQATINNKSAPAS